MKDLNKKFLEYQKKKGHTSASPEPKKGLWSLFHPGKREHDAVAKNDPPHRKGVLSALRSTIRGHSASAEKDTEKHQGLLSLFRRKKDHGADRPRKDDDRGKRGKVEKALDHARVGESESKKGFFSLFKRSAAAHNSEPLRSRREDALHRKYKELFNDEPKEHSMFYDKKLDIDHELLKLKKAEQKKGALPKSGKDTPTALPTEPEVPVPKKAKRPFWSFIRKKDRLDEIREELEKPLEKKVEKKPDKKAERKKAAEPEKAGAEERESPKSAKRGFLDLFRREKAKGKTAEVKEKDIRLLFKKKAKEKKRSLTAAERRRRLAEYLEKAGLEIDTVNLSKLIFRIALSLTTLIIVVYVYLNFRKSAWVPGIFIQVTVIWVLGFLLIWGLSWVVFRIYLDLLMFRRKLQVEEVLPDFLQLTSANLRAGMPIDRALWFAVRPRFGVLAKEIEDVAKRTLTGEDLSVALVDFAKKYDSPTLLRSVHLLNEGMDAGGDIAELLNKIAINITQMRSMKKEMAANVTTYVIFIVFASLVAAPFLFGLSKQLLEIVQTIAKGVGSGGMKGGAGLSINISSDNIKLSDYKIFAYSCLIMSSIFSAIIVTTIRKGNIREGLHYIPLFVAVSVFMFFMATFILGKMLGGMFGGG